MISGLKISALEGEFSVCRLKNACNARMVKPFVSLTVTGKEVSLVCPSGEVPLDCVSVEKGWRCLKIAGPLDFSLVGVLAGVSAALAKNGVSIFAVSTYDTDYILVKADRFGDAVRALKESGCEFPERGTER